MPGGGHFQPSEWVKLILILAVAKYFADLHDRELSWPDFLKAGASWRSDAAGPGTTGLGNGFDLFADCDHGLVSRWAALEAGVDSILIGADSGTVLFSPMDPNLEVVSEGTFDEFYAARKRIGQGSGYQVNQSQIAVGSGGILGSSQGSQTHLAFLPVPQTDFIFAAFAEEHGFVGGLGVLLLYFIVLMRLTQNAQTAPDRAGAFLVMGVVAVLSFHILVNVGMVVGFMPVTGIPLPLMSYGGSSVLFMFLALGIVMNVRMRRFVN